MIHGRQECLDGRFDRGEDGVGGYSFVDGSSVPTILGGHPWILLGSHSRIEFLAKKHSALTRSYRLQFRLFDPLHCG